jgi:hypothetical protein
MDGLDRAGNKPGRRTAVGGRAPLAAESGAGAMRRRGGFSTLSRLTEAVGSTPAGRKILTAS